MKHTHPQICSAGRATEFKYGVHNCGDFCGDPAFILADFCTCQNKLVQDGN